MVPEAPAIDSKVKSLTDSSTPVKATSSGVAGGG